jgi:hypothetical protein
MKKARLGPAPHDPCEIAQDMRGEKSLLAITIVFLEASYSWPKAKSAL